MTAEWTYPIVESMHIVGIVVMVGAALLFDLRLLGVAGRNMPVTALARFLLPVSRTGFGLVVVTGALMFAANATQLVHNPALQVKLLLIVVAGANILAFHLSPYRRISDWDTVIPTPTGAKAAAVLSIVLWVVIISCGRLIAYM
ncbi:DUF6644 family protein [Bacillus gobiensis]|uniref:DUF6644 family protein n=1 Tax=Bacillus gobiensis TaxID=1441095 RepID=UPI003D206D56